MKPKTTIHRFIEAQQRTHNIVKLELLREFKESCWMWYTFPQIVGLGYSDIAKYYEFQCLGEVRAFAANTYLNHNMSELVDILLNMESSDADWVFGGIDARKLQSSMTVLGTTHQFQVAAGKVLEKFFDGKPCEKTLAIIETMEDK